MHPVPSLHRFPNYIIIFMFMPFRKIFFYETVILTQSAIKHSFSEICIKEAGKSSLFSGGLSLLDKPGILTQ